MSDSNRSHVLRKLADLLEAHPEVEMPIIDSYDDEITKIRFQFTSHGEKAAAAASVVMKAFPGAFKKTYANAYFFMSGEFEGVPVEINTYRADVCVARKVGTETKQVKDPEALKAIPMVEIKVPVYEYDCKPILGDAA
jgi:hypothetical protein